MPRRTPQKKAGKTVAKKLFNDFVLRFGFPAGIHHDQGGEFEKGMGKSTALTELFQRCCGRCLKVKNAVGKIIGAKSCTPITPHETTPPDIHLTSCYLDATEITN